MSFAFLSLKFFNDIASPIWKTKFFGKFSKENPISSPEPAQRFVYFTQAPRGWAPFFERNNVTRQFHKFTTKAQYSMAQKYSIFV